MVVGSAFVALLPFTETSPQAQTIQAPPPPPQPQIKAAPPTPIAQQKAELGDDETWQPEWDIIVEKELPIELLSPKVAKAVKPFFGGYFAKVAGIIDKTPGRFWPVINPQN